MGTGWGGAVEGGDEGVGGRWGTGDRCKNFRTSEYDLEDFHIYNSFLAE